MTAYQGRVITAVVLPRTATVNAVLVVSFALLTALAAQITIPLPFTPVPITGQTFAVLLAGAALGSRLGATSQGLYWALGATGLPFYADGGGGWQAATGATAGYLAGFIVAAYVVGFLAERQQDRNVATAIPAFLTGSAIIYLFGVGWLWYSVDTFVTAEAAMAAGLTPFIVGDLIKIALAGVLLPTAWKLVGDARRP
ncbi:MAG: biotin transporter BioY [Acidimicrobiia bacterium]|nr:biotin transporter BioY [Acidimicrobiia bacterium]